jgi:ParB-like nuclease domain
VSADRWQLLLALTPDEFAALKADVAARGVLVPIERDATGAILDGHHRVQALAELRAEGHALADAPTIIRSPTEGSAMKRSYSITVQGDDAQEEACCLLREITTAGIEPGEGEPTLLCLHDARLIGKRVRR